MSLGHSKRKDAIAGWTWLLGMAMFPIFIALSAGPAIWYSEQTEDAKIIFHYPGNQPVWASPGMYRFSKLMMFMACASGSVSVAGLFWVAWRAQRKPKEPADCTAEPPGGAKRHSVGQRN